MALTVANLTAPLASQSPREWLSTQTNDAGDALAIFPSRGRFGKDAVEALAHAEAQGWKFAEPVKATPAPKATPTVAQATQTALNQQAPRVSAPAPRPTPAPTTLPATAQASFNAKEVRSWAKANGHTVGDRGRIRPEVIAAFAKAGGKPVGPRAARPTPLDMPKVRPQGTGYAVRGNTVVAQTICGARSCGAAVSRCACKGGPVSFPLDGTVTPLALTKPSL